MNGLFDGNYLESLEIDDNVKKILIDKMNESLPPGQNIQSIVSETIAEKGINNKTRWVKCIDTCKDKLTPFIDAELNSTAYMLRLLSKSIVSVEPSSKLVIDFRYTSLETITGIWEEDEKNITISTSDADSGSEKRLIMGFGPSASGKTFWTEKLIEMIGENDKSFPKIFLSIDGGIARETSNVYQRIIDEIEKNNNIDGFANLVAAMGGSSLFKSDTVKKAINKYLGAYDEPPISLYVPTTASGLNNPYKKYVDITKDKKWIGVYIWQHKTKCPYEDEFKCETTEECGKTREKEEGKKFGSKAYGRSKRNGRNYLRIAPGGQIDIHNSGSKDRKSIVTEYDVREKYLLNDGLVLKHGGVYKRKGREEVGDAVSIVAKFSVEKYGGRNTRSKHTRSKHTRSKHTRSKHTRSKHTRSKHTRSKHTRSKHTGRKKKRTRRQRFN